MTKIVFKYGCNLKTGPFPVSLSRSPGLMGTLSGSGNRPDCLSFARSDSTLAGSFLAAHAFFAARSRLTRPGVPGEGVVYELSNRICCARPAQHSTGAGRIGL